MKDSIEISLVGMIMTYALLLPALFLMFYYKLGLIKDTIISIIRMSIQLFLVGLYLKYIFLWNNIFINLLWISFMIAVATWTTVKQSSLVLKKVFSLTFISLFTAFFLVLSFFVFFITDTNLSIATITVPIAGMLLGNSLRGNVIVLDRFYSLIKKNEQEYLLKLLYGATHKEATASFKREAIRAGIMPQIASMATMGIVSLPGMMTGQLLGGALPMEAIKYQIAIMIGIFCSVLFSSTLVLSLVNKIAFLPSGKLDEKIFTK